jgi:hypothetical protein
MARLMGDVPVPSQVQIRRQLASPYSRTASPREEMSHVTRTEVDELGRTTATIRNYGNGTPSGGGLGPEGQLRLHRRPTYEDHRRRARPGHGSGDHLHLRNDERHRRRRQ